MRAFIGIVALNAVLNVLLMTDSMDGLMWIMTGAAFHFAIGSEVALAAEHPHGLKAGQSIGIIPQFLLGDAARQPMAVSTKLDLRLDIPAVTSYRVGRRVLGALGLTHMLAAGAVTLFAVYICNQIFNSAFRKSGGGRVAVHAPLSQFAACDVTESFQIACWLFFSMPNRHSETCVGVATDAMLDPFGHTVSSTGQCQNCASAMPRPESILQWKIGWFINIG